MELKDNYYIENIEKLIKLAKGFDTDNLYGIFCIEFPQEKYFSEKVYPILDFMRELSDCNHEREIYAESINIAHHEESGDLEIKHFAVNNKITGELKELILNKTPNGAKIYDLGHPERSYKIKWLTI